MSARALVTGAAGFAGQWLVRALLARGHQVEAWVRRPSAQLPPAAQQQLVDLSDSDAVARTARAFRGDWVFHLGAWTHPGRAENHPALVWQTNVAGTAALAASLDGGQRLVFASTCHVYAPSGGRPILETDPTGPRGVYARSKLAAEAACGAHAHPIIARAFHHTGPGQSTDYVLADWAAQVRERGPGTTVHTGELDLWRDFMDVRDVVTAYILLAEQGQAGEIYNICSGRACRLGDLLRAMSVPPPQPLVQSSRLRANENPRMVGNPGKLHRLGHRPIWDVEQTLAEMALSLRERP